MNNIRQERNKVHMLVMPLVIQSIADDNDRQLMEQIYIEFHRLMFATAWKYINAAFDVEDIVSDSCLCLYKKIDLLRSMEYKALKTYIVATVRNNAIDFLRKQQRTDALFLKGDEEKMEQIAHKETVENQIVLSEELHTVRTAISRLAPKEREILRLKFQQEKKDCEIAEIIGISESSVRTYIIRSRQHLKKIVYKGESL